MKRWQIFLLVVLALVIIGGAGYLGFKGSIPFAQKDTPEMVEAPPTVAVTRGEVKQTIIAPGQLVNYKTVNLPMGASGPVSEVYVRPGDKVEEGDVLVRLGNISELEAAVALAKIDQLDAQQAFDSLSENAPLSLAQALLDLLDAQEIRDTADRYLLYLNNWSDSKSVRKSSNYWGPDEKPSASTIVEAEANLAIAETELANTQAHYDSLVDGIDPNELAHAEANLAITTAELAVAEAELTSVELMAPFDGVVLDVSVSQGQTVSKGFDAVEMTDPHALEVLISIIEEDYPLIEEGQLVEIYIDAIPDAILTGHIDRIVPKRVSTESPLYQVYISIDDVPEMVVEGMTADTDIILAQSSDVLRLPRALVQANSDGTATVSVWVRDHAEERSITVGLRGDVYIEILSGLEEGEQVVAQ